MKKSLLAATLALSCICTLCVAGCGSSATNTNANNTNTASTASVATNTNNTANTTNTANTASTTNASNTAASTSSSSASTSSTTSTSTATEAGTPEDALTKITDEGVTSLSADQLQDLMDNSLDIDMTLANVRSTMGGVKGSLMGDGFEANTYAWYTADKSKALIATFTGQDDGATLTACRISIDEDE